MIMLLPLFVLGYTQEAVDATNDQHDTDDYVDVLHDAPPFAQPSFFLFDPVFPT